MNYRSIALIVVFFVGVGTGVFSWMVYYDTHIRADKLQLLRGKELQSVINVMMSRQTFDTVRRELQAAFPTELPWMHVIGHYVGEFWYRKHGLKAIGMCDTSYNHGCYHGVVQYAARVHGPDPDFLQKLYDACVTQKKTSEDCSDPLGHASVTLTAFNMPKAFDLCERFFTTDKERMYCGLGVFMEYFNTYTDRIFPPSASKDTLRNVCQSFPLFYQPGCVELSLYYIRNTYRYTFEQLIEHCRSFAHEPTQKRCDYGVGAVSAEQSMYMDVDPMDICHRANITYGDDCFLGIIRTYESVGQPARLGDVCPLIKDAEIQAACRDIEAGNGSFKAR